VSATVVVAVLLLAGLTAVVLTVRSVRRRCRRWRLLDARARRRQLLERGVAALAASPLAHPGWWLAQRERHRLWRSVTAADRAVTAAVSEDAPVGDLPQLCRRLRRSADAVDASIRAAGGAVPAATQGRVSEVVELADQVRRAAADAVLAGSAEPAAGGLADAIAVEVAALRHGLAAMSSGRPR